MAILIEKKPIVLGLPQKLAVIEQITANLAFSLIFIMKEAADESGFHAFLLGLVINRKGAKNAKGIVGFGFLAKSYFYLCGLCAFAVIIIFQGGHQLK